MIAFQGPRFQETREFPLAKKKLTLRSTLENKGNLSVSSDLELQAIIHICNFFVKYLDV